MKAMLRATLVSIALATLALAPTVHAQPTPDRAPVVVVRPEVMQRVERALFVIEGEAPASFFATLGAEGQQALLTIVRDRSRSLGLRRRAVLALHHYDAASVRAELEARAASSTEDAILSRYALRALALAFGPAAFEVVAARLADGRALVREGAAIALAEIDAPRARPILTAHARTEGELFVRETIARLVAD